MKVIKPAKTEKEILVSVSQEADKRVIQQSITEKAEANVDHLCGCNCKC